MGENDIIKYESGIIRRVGNQIGVTNKLLALSKRQLIPYRKRNKWGFCTSDKQIFIDCVYDKVSLFYQDISIAEKDKKKIIVNVSGKEIFTDYDQISFYQGGVASISKGGKYAFININGEQITELIYDRVDLFYEGMTRVKRNNKYGFVNTNGEEIILCVHDNAGRFENGIAWVQINNRYAFVDKLGKLITGFIFINDEYLSDSFRYNYTSFHFSNGRAKVFKCDSNDFSYSHLDTVDEGIKWGYIDNAGNQIIPFLYDVAVDFQEDFAVVGVFLGTTENRIKSSNGIDIYVDEEQIVKYGFINKYGDLVISFDYDSAASFSEGMACVSKGNKFGFISNSGDLITSLQYDFAQSFSEGMACIKKGNKYGFINIFGIETIPCKYDYAESFLNGYAKVRQNGKYGFINQSGNEIIPCIYDKTYSFIECMCPVCKNDLWGFVNHSGIEVIPCQFEKDVFQATDKFDNGLGLIYPNFYQGLKKVKRNNKYGFINMEGEEVIECVFDEVFELSDVIIVKKNWKYGLFSKTTKREIIECVFDSISTTSDENLLLVNKDKLSGYINKKGDKYWED